MVDKKKLQESVKTVFESKGTRKFKQSIELAINFKDIDFKKAENRINLDVVLPLSPKEAKIAIFADGQLALEAKTAGADLVIPGPEISSYAKNKKKQKELLAYRFLAQPQLMVEVGKSLGQVLGTRGLLPKPIPPSGNLKQLIALLRKTVNIKTKGKFLPSVHVLVGNEDLDPEQVVDNAIAVLDAVEHKVGLNSIKSVFVKATMSKPVKVI
ncbi:MAG: 50S ribosomal protein L1 [Candidatus Micrarchaeota archaeon]